jgi:hypothetical protein
VAEKPRLAQAALEGAKAAFIGSPAFLTLADFHRGRVYTVRIAAALAWRSIGVARRTNVLPHRGGASWLLLGGAFHCLCRARGIQLPQLIFRDPANRDTVATLTDASTTVLHLEAAPRARFAFFHLRLLSTPTENLVFVIA